MTNPIKAIIHGHFYQPPREDPWTNIIYNQDSAYPYKNWNERITRECYGPNCYSRVLDKDGKITDIINNYKYISFNFGPTLLSYLEKKEREIYNLILDADKYSVEKHSGHGNAIAQVYNHVILPLQKDDDKITEIVWGLKDFEKKFGRTSEGIWLSETAIDYRTVDLLIDFKIKFIVLSPNQAASYRKIGDEKWIKASEHPVKTTHPYKIIREKGEIAVFYFDKALSSSVSFEHLLHNADNFANSIIHNKSITEEGDVVVIASDGEVYGHHEPFADMCLASLIKNYHLKNRKIEFYNFGEYLEKYPPLYETQISLGEDGKGSSWSCFHGVLRWYKNCGCQTGGKQNWDQKWRTPLRESFDNLKIKIDELYFSELKDIIKSPGELRNDYIEYIYSDYDRNNTVFIDKFKARELTVEEINRIITLLESQKYALFMYTSCGWFFSEITGIETVQNIRYAYKAIHLLKQQDKIIKKEFESKMEEALSNIPEFKNGKWIVENWVYPEIQDIKQIANNFIIILKYNSDISIDDFEISKYFGYENFQVSKIYENKFTGNITVINKIINTRCELFFLINEEKPGIYKNFITENPAVFEKIADNVSIDDIGKNEEDVILSQYDLLPDVKEYLLNLLNTADVNQVIAMNINQINRIIQILMKYHLMNTKIPLYLKDLFKNSTQSYFHYLVKKFDGFPKNEYYIDMLKIIEMAKLFNIDLDTVELKNNLSTLLYKSMSKDNDPFSEVCEKAINMLIFCYKAGLIIEKSRCENIIFQLLKTRTPELIRKIHETSSEDDKVKIMLQFRKLLTLSDMFNINTDEEKKMFFKYF